MREFRIIERISTRDRYNSELDKRKEKVINWKTTKFGETIESV
jgi:hypothetical protein